MASEHVSEIPENYFDQINNDVELPMQILLFLACKKDDLLKDMLSDIVETRDLEKFYNSMIALKVAAEVYAERQDEEEAKLEVEVRSEGQNNSQLQSLKRPIEMVRIEEKPEAKVAKTDHGVEESKESGESMVALAGSSTEALENGFDMAL